MKKIIALLILLPVLCLAQSKTTAFTDGTSFYYTVNTTLLENVSMQLAPFLLPQHTFTTNHTADGTNVVIVMNASANSITLTLPSANSTTNRLYYVKSLNASTYTNTVDGAGTDTIDGAATMELHTDESLTIQSDGGTNWIIL